MWSSVFVFYLSLGCFSSLPRGRQGWELVSGQQLHSQLSTNFTEQQKQKLETLSFHERHPENIKSYLVSSML